MAFPWDTNVNLEEVLSWKISVPDYQRDYAWDVDEATDFIGDLIDFVESKEESYLFGQFIFYDEGDIKYIIDGQQRITTTTIFMAVVRNIVATLEFDREDEDYTSFSSCILKTIGSEKKGEFKLTIKGNGRSYFEQYIQRASKPKNGGKYKATKHIKKVYDVLESSILDYIDDCKNDQEKFETIYKITNRLMNGFVVSTISTSDLSQAYTIFETLNSRGKDLEPSDLLKNYFFQRCKSNLSLVKNEWAEIDNEMDEAKASITHFIRCYWNSGNDLVRQRALYRAISKELKSDDEVKQFVDGLYNTYQVYLSMFDPQHYDYFKKAEIQDIIQNLSILNAKMYYPIVMACVRSDVDVGCLHKVLKAIESLIVRNIIIGPENANTYESEFSQYANKITAEGSNAVDEVIKIIKNKTLSDDRFSAYFEKATIKETKVSRLILAEIYNFENGKELKINPNTSEVNVEHIMPQSNEIWNVSKDIHDNYLNYLGNQTLLLKEDNASVSNDNFSVKKIAYSRSKLKQNAVYFANISSWGKDEIEERQKALLKTALRRW